MPNIPQNVTSSQLGNYYIPVNHIEDVFHIEDGDFPAIAMLVYQRVVFFFGWKKTPNETSKLITGTQQESLRRDLQKPAANLGEFAGRFWSQIWDETYCFDKVDKEMDVGLS